MQNFTSGNIFTDISKNQNGIGRICSYMEQHGIYVLPNSSSVFTAESTAVLKALDIIAEHQLQDTIIFIDSLSTVKNIQNTYNSSNNYSNNYLIK